MKKINFTSLDECFECYGRENLIAIDCLKQCLFYLTKGVQPCFVYENELKPGKLTFWFLKSESNFVYRKWIEQGKNKKHEESR